MVTTLLLPGLATFAVGFVPTYDQIGIWGAVILTIIRFIQGVGVGGEWGGSGAILYLSRLRPRLRDPILHIQRDFLLTSLSAAGITSFVTIPLAGHLSDRIGRRRMYIIGAAATGIVGFIYFAMLNTTVPAWIFLGIVLSFIANDLMYGPQAAPIAECFTPR